MKIKLNQFTHSLRLKYLLINTLAVFSLLMLVAIPAQSNEAEVVDVKITSLGNDKYRIDTTIKHSDTGWKHYANAWLIYDESGKQLGERILHHPHVNEQPFTRSLTVKIPTSVKKIIIKAQDSIHGLNEQGKVIDVPR